MAGRDIFPNMPDSRERGRFRMATSRRQDLTLQQELEDVGKKSIADIIVSKEIKTFEPVSGPEKTVRKLAPEFKQKKAVDKRKSQPVFHEGIKSPRSRSPVHPSLPQYNPLDKEKTFSTLQLQDWSKSKKLPFSKENTVTTEEMKKPRVTSLGVLPPQHGKALPELNVMMEGVPAQKHDDDPVLGPVERANTAPLVEAETSMPEPAWDVTLASQEKGQKPAILGAVGTQQAVVLSERPAPATKPMSHLKVPRHKSAKSVHSDTSSFKSIELHLPGESDFGDTVGDMMDPTAPPRGKSGNRTADDQRSQTSSAMTMKSVKDLVEEAKKIATPEGGAKTVKRVEKKEDAKKSEAPVPPKTGSKAVQKTAPVERKKGKGKPTKDEPQTTERSVDEIIKSLKEQATSGVISEADRKIQEIMNQVISKSKAVLGDLAPSEPEVEQEQPEEVLPEQALFPGAKRDLKSLKNDLGSDLDNTSSTKDKPLPSIDEKEDRDEDKPADSEGQGQKAEADPMLTERSEAVDDLKEQEQPSGHTSVIDEALERLSEVRTSANSPAVDNMPAKAPDNTPDLTQAWEDIMAPSEVAFEDIINVTAKSSKLHAKNVPEESKTDPNSAPQAPVSLLGSWTPAKETHAPEASSAEYVGKHPVKSIHHFCSLREDIQLPDHQRGVWRRYHVPSKYDYLYKDSMVPHADAHNTPQSHTPGSAQPDRPDASPAPPSPLTDHADLDRHQSFIAQRILEEAGKVQAEEEQKGSKLEAWQQRAQQVFDQSQLNISGKKMELKSDESFLYWTPAPPKWDVAPNDVKEVLFPSYHGAALGMEQDPNTPSPDSDDSDAGEDLQAPEEDPETRLARERILSRQHGSARDLTALDKTMIQKAEQHAPEKLRNITGSIRLPKLTFSPQLADHNSQEYAAKKAEIEQVLSNVFANVLGDHYRGIRNIGFSGGSLVVHYAVGVPESAPPELSETFEEALLLAIKRGMFGDVMVDSTSVLVADDVTNRTELLLREISQKSSLRPPVTQPHLTGRREVSDVTGMAAHHDSEPLLNELGPRPSSAPGQIDKDDDDTLLIYQDYNTAMAEVKRQKALLKENKSAKKQEADTEDKSLTTTPELDNSSKQTAQDRTTLEIESPRTTVRIEEEISRFSSALAKQKEVKLTPAEEALEAGRSYVLLPNKNKKKQKKIAMADMARIEAIEAFAKQRPRKLTRRESFSQKKRQVEWELRVPMRVRHRKSSLPRVMDFEEYKNKKHYKSHHHDNEREWVRSIWDRWFDQTYPPTPPESDWEDEEEEEFEEQVSLVREEKPIKRKSSVASTVYSEDVVIPPVTEYGEEAESVELLQEEVERLTKDIESTDKPSAFDYCRRGAIQRKLGNIKPALEDLTTAITMEPMMLDAYWNRHFAYILLNKKIAALDDLNMVLKHNKQHSGAYRSRAAIHKDKGDITLAIVNYTQAVKFNPEDDQAFYQRAEMYEERGEMLLAMEDYAQTFKINPKKTEALFRHGMHYYNNRNWQNAIQDFTDLLKHDPNNARARMIRGRTYAQLQQWNQAVEDLSAAIHLDPRNSKAFYYRACLLRKLHPKKAVQDYSVSLMLDDSENNIMAYLHRGILYNEIGRHEDAMPDFEAVLKLDKEVASAHVNLGLICMQKLQNHQRAIKKFSAAIKADPTYVKAYICRAEAYTQVHDIKNALLDITRAIHLRPDMNHLYMYRGQLVLKMGNLDLAAFCVRHAAELNAGLGQSPTQQAIVQTFLKNYNKAIDALEAATRVKPVPPLFMLLGKTRMKAQLWKDAVDAFEQALELVKPWQAKQSWPPEAAEMYYLIGMCQMEMRDYLHAHDAFNSAIQVDKKLADAYYWRGMTRMKLKQSKGIQDFNRALALDPELFQAYLSRAAYYGLKGQYSKGILNCNEAIRLQPTSVRGHLYRGALKYHIKAYTLAIRDLSQAIAIDSTCALAYFNRAVCYHDSGNFEKALQDYGIVLLLGDYLSLKVLINRGLLYFETKDYKNALHDFLMAAEVNPRDKRIHHTLGLCYHKLNRLEEAVKSFTRALQLDSFFLDALIGRGNVFMDFGHEVGHLYARHDYERALHLNPCYLPARVNLAYNLQVAGRFQQAWHQFTAAININNKFKPALEGRAIINLQMSDTFAAFQDINASVNIQPTAELLTNRGVVHQFMGDRVNAMRDYQQAVKLDPSYSLAYFNAANIYFHTRQFVQACRYYDSAIVHNSKDESAYLNRAITRVMLKDAPGALKDFDSAIGISPHSAHIYFNRGNLYTSLMMYDKADTNYTKALELRPDDPLVHKRRADVRGKLGQKDAAIADYKRAILIQSQHGKR